MARNRIRQPVKWRVTPCFNKPLEVHIFTKNKNQQGQPTKVMLGASLKGHSALVAKPRNWCLSSCAQLINQTVFVSETSVRFSFVQFTSSAGQFFMIHSLIVRAQISIGFGN